MSALASLAILFLCFEYTWFCFPQHVAFFQVGMANPHLDSRSVCEWRSGHCAGLCPGKPTHPGSAKCSNRSHREPTPAPDVSSTPLQLLNCPISGPVLTCAPCSVTLPLYGRVLDSALKAQHYPILYLSVKPTLTMFSTLKAEKCKLKTF